MIFEKIESKGLAHYSYLVGDEGKAFIIDPMRDVQGYVDLANKYGLVITDIFETHRNEDYVTGCVELSEITGADIHISKYEDLGFEFGSMIAEGDEFEFGSLKLKALHTPGHTLGHMSYVLYESERENPYMIFTGDCIFMGDLGRTDFYGEDKLDEMTGLLYDSIFEKILPLGDGVLMMPAHGAGSACGESMEDRPYSTLGYERLNNPKLQVSGKEEFIESFGKMRVKPRYFEKMEVYNVEGGPAIGSNVELPPLSLEDIDENDRIIDLRSPAAVVGYHIPDSTYVGLSNLAVSLGNLFDTEDSIVFLAENDNEDILAEAYWDARRTGFENVKGYIKDGITAFNESGGQAEDLEAITAEEYVKIENKVNLDVRKVDKLNEIGKNGDTFNIPLEVLYKEYEILPKDETVYVLCGTGTRATIATSYLTNLGYNPCVVIGGVKAIKKTK